MFVVWFFSCLWCSYALYQLSDSEQIVIEEVAEKLVNIGQSQQVSNIQIQEILQSFTDTRLFNDRQARLMHALMDAVADKFEDAMSMKRPILLSHNETTQLIPESEGSCATPTWATIYEWAYQLVYWDETFDLWTMMFTAGGAYDKRVDLIQLDDKTIRIIYQYESCSNLLARLFYQNDDGEIQELSWYDVSWDAYLHGFVVKEKIQSLDVIGNSRLDLSYIVEWMWWQVQEFMRLQLRDYVDYEQRWYLEPVVTFPKQVDRVEVSTYVSVPENSDLVSSPVSFIDRVQPSYVPRNALYHDWSANESLWENLLWDIEPWRIDFANGMHAWVVDYGVWWVEDSIIFVFDEQELIYQFVDVVSYAFWHQQNRILLDSMMYLEEDDTYVSTKRLIDFETKDQLTLSTGEWCFSSPTQYAFHESKFMVATHDGPFSEEDQPDSVRICIYDDQGTYIADIRSDANRWAAANRYIYDTWWFLGNQDILWTVRHSPAMTHEIVITFLDIHKKWYDTYEALVIPNAISYEHLIYEISELLEQWIDPRQNMGAFLSLFDWHVPF